MDWLDKILLCLIILIGAIIVFAAPILKLMIKMVDIYEEEKYKREGGSYHESRK
jgi:hypothetical protein